MSPAKLLGLLKSGDMIIVPGAGNVALRVRPQTFLHARMDAADHNQLNSRKLLRDLIARRKGKK